MSLLQFIATLAGVLSIWGLFSLRKSGNPIKYLKKHKDVFSGIKFAILFSIIMASLSLLSGCSGTWVRDGTVYVGLDMPSGRSPQCLDLVGQYDDKTTSNLGLKLNIFESDDTKFRTNAKYTHHSCAFNSDVRIYDALGVEFEYKIFQR